MPDKRTWRILNVDDNEAGRYAVNKILKAAGFLVIEAENGRGALQKVKEEHPDLVLLDVNMPDINGLEVCKQIKKDPRTASIPVVHLSATAILSRERVQGLDGGADGYLVEPVDPDELVATIGSFLRTKEAMETTLRESAERLKFALEGTNDGIWDVQMDTGAMYLSPRGYEILGYPPEEQNRNAQTWSQLVHPDDLPATTVALNRYLEGSAPIFDVEQRLKTKSGNWKWVQTRGKAISRTENGAPVRMVGTHTDISDRKIAEDNLSHVTRLYAVLSHINQAIVRTREQDELLRTICQIAIDIGQFYMAWIGLTDEANDTIIPVTHAGHEDGYLDKILITTGDLPSGKGPTGSAFREGMIKISHDIANDPRMLPWREDALKRGYRSSAAVPLRCKGKTMGVLNLYATKPGFFTADEQKLLLEIGDDISFALDAMASETERRKAEKQLRDAALHWQITFNSTQDAICLFDADQRIVQCNHMMQKLLSAKNADDLIGRQCWEVVHGTTGPIPGCPHSRMQASLKRETMELKVGERWFVVITDPILDEKRMLVGAVHNMRDITDRKLAENALHHANKKLNILSSITRHDINNQLLTLNAFVEYLHNEVTDPALEGYFTRVTTASSQISAMIQFTKEYEKIGISAPVWQDVRVLIDTAAKQAPLGKVALKNDLPAGAEVFADPLIVKVFYNLMDNAVRHGGKIMTIRFSTEEPNGDRTIICEDDGDGIPAEDKERIFDRGFGKNTGLGLALAREILDITGITIRETGEPGKGARFEMAVPKGGYRFNS